MKARAYRFFEALRSLRMSDASNGGGKGRSKQKFGFDPEHPNDVDELPLRKCAVCRKRVHAGVVVCTEGDCTLIFDTFWSMREQSKLPNGVENITQYRIWYLEEKLKATAKHSRNPALENILPLAATAT